MSNEYLWISRWEEFQHYAPERDRAPAWIKTYTKQLDDDRYLDLNHTQRALLADLRLEFSRARAELRMDRRRLTLRLGLTVYQRDLERLNHAGFIEIISRATLDQRLEQVYSGSRPRARPRGHGDGEKEKEIENPPPPNPEEPQPLSESYDPTDTTYEAVMWRRAMENGAGWSRNHKQPELIEPDSVLPPRQPEGDGI